MALKIKIFTQEGCPKCPAAKELGQKLAQEFLVEWYDVQTIEGLTEASYFQVLSTPTIILTDEDNQELLAWRGEVPQEKELKKQISQLSK